MGSEARSWNTPLYFSSEAYERVYEISFQLFHPLFSHGGGGGRFGVKGGKMNRFAELKVVEMEEMDQKIKRKYCTSRKGRKVSL